MKKPDYFTKCGPGKRPLFAAFDFETDGLGGKLLAASYAFESRDKIGAIENVGYITHSDPFVIMQRIFDVMCENNEYTWFAHNAQYEFRYFIPLLQDLKERVNFYNRTDSDVFMITIALPEYGEKAQLIMRDSAAIFAGTLKQFTLQFCPELPKLDFNFETTIFDPKNPEHKAYSMRDSEALLLALCRFDALVFENFDVHIRATSASTALAAWQRTLDKDEKYYNAKEDEKFVREGYYGGLVFLTETNKYSNVNSYDINSSYPYQMLTHPMPLGKAYKTLLFHNNMPGIYKVTVKSPDDIIVPILPKRDGKGIVWPSGVFETTVTSEELKFAVKNGYGVLKIHDGKVWQSTCKPFDKFIRICMDLRKKHKGTALETTAKLMQNSLYGKFCAKRERRKIYGELSEDDCIGAEMWGDFYIKTETADDMQCLPQWGVFITAHARLHLLRAVYDIGARNVLYGDTDSITLKPGFGLEESANYGGWKLDKKWCEFRAHGPKVYAGIINGATGFRGAAKGLPKKLWGTSGVLEKILAGASEAPVIVRYTRLEKFVISLKTEYIGTHEAHRSLSALGNSRTWKQLPDGHVRPRSWQEIENFKNISKRGGIAKRKAS